MHSDINVLNGKTISSAKVKRDHHYLCRNVHRAAIPGHKPAQILVRCQETGFMTAETVYNTDERQCCMVLDDVMKIWHGNRSREQSEFDI